MAAAAAQADALGLSDCSAAALGGVDVVRATLRALACMYAARRLGAPRATAQAGCSHQVSLV